MTLADITGYANAADTIVSELTPSAAETATDGVKYGTEIILLAAVLPAILLLVYIYWKDKYQREPVSQMLKGFFYGVLSVFIAAVIDVITGVTGLVNTDFTSIPGAVNTAFLGAAIPEECAKLLMLWLLLRRNKYFDENFDGIVYATCVGMGFAATENIMYVFRDVSQWQGIAIGRAVSAVPGHFLFAVAMGYFYSLAHFGKGGFRAWARVLFWPIMLHGIYDSIVMSIQVNVVLAIVLLPFFFYFFYKMAKYGRKRIVTLLERDKEVLDKHGTFTVFAEQAAQQKEKTDEEENNTEYAGSSPTNTNIEHPVLRDITYNEEDYMPKPKDEV